MLSRELFIETIEKIKQQYQHDVRCSKLLSQIYPNAFEANLMYQNNLLVNQIVKILQVELNDELPHSLVEFFIWELDFGKKQKQGNCSAWRKDGSAIDLSDAGKLYDFLIENMEDNKQSSNSNQD